MDWTRVLDAAVKVVGFVMSVAVAVGVIVFVRKSLADLLGRVITDGIIASSLTKLTVILLVLKGTTAALRYVTQDELRYLHAGLTGLLDEMASVIQWVVLVAAILFVGHTFWGARQSSEDWEDSTELS